MVSKRMLALVLSVVLVLAVSVEIVAAEESAGVAALQWLKNLKGWNTITVQVLNQKLDLGEKVFVLDVRTPEEFAAGHIPGAVNVEGHTIADNLGKLPADKTALIVVNCKSGVRSTYVAMALGMSGYTNALTLVGGFDAWAAAGFKVEK